jgi:hypothetical protein
LGFDRQHMALPQELPAIGVEREVLEQELHSPIRREAVWMQLTTPEVRKIKKRTSSPEGMQPATAGTLPAWQQTVGNWRDDGQSVSGMPAGLPV